MFNKIYVKIKDFLKKNYLYIIGFIIGIVLATYELPYYIDAPGGVIDVSSKIEIDDSYDVSGSFNMAYVSEYKATLPILLIAKFNKDWNIQKKSDVLGKTETDKDAYVRDHLMLEEANQNAVIYAYQKAGKEVNLSNTKVYAIYIYDEARTDLKVGDQILEVNDIKIDNKQMLVKEVHKYNVGDKLKIKVINDGKEYLRTAEIVDVDGMKLIGIMLCQISDYEVNPNIKINYSKSESGPSGGLLMSLSIYNYLTEEDITQGKKIAGTGTIDEMGNVGSIGGVEYKIKGAVKAKIKYFLVPAGENYEEAMKIKKENNYDIEIVPIKHFDDALDYLRSIG